MWLKVGLKVDYFKVRLKVRLQQRWLQRGRVEASFEGVFDSR